MDCRQSLWADRIKHGGAQLGDFLRVRIARPTLPPRTEFAIGKTASFAFW
jgi:hypothetical protein